MLKIWSVLLLSCSLLLISCSKDPSTQNIGVIQTVKNTVVQLVAPPAQVSPSFQLSQVALDLVTDAEVSASSTEGHKYYDKHYQTATFPGEGSGATWAIGVDGSQNTAQWTITSWTPYFDDTIVKRLADCTGHTSVSAAKEDVKNLQDIIIVWNTALNEFNTQEVPNYYQTALRVFPGLDNLSINAQSSVLSVTYNRGFSMIGASRVDMRNLRTAVANGDYKAMSAAILHMNVTMASSWKSEGIYAGMVVRRKAEATLALTPDS